jgi:tRNA(Ile)-lysidine synthase
VVERVIVADGNLEQQARLARYAAFEKHRLANEIVVLAHHQQDQAETLLLRLFSGTGVNGLSAMRELDIRDHLTLWRPLLDMSREHIETWLAKTPICYIDDPTNLDTYYDRAWSRQALWPLISTRFPKMQQAIARTSLLMQDASDMLQEIYQQDLAQCGNADALDLDQYAQLSEARKRQLLSNWMKGDAAYRPSLDMVQRLQREVIAAKQDAQALLQVADYYYLRYQRQLVRLSSEVYAAAQQISPTTQHNFQRHEIVNLPSGKFHIQEHADIGLSFALLGKAMCLDARQGGEKIHLYGRVGHWPLKKALQERKIAPWQRQTIQILRIENVMLGVFTPQGFWLAQSPYCVEGGWLPKWVSL